MTKFTATLPDGTVATRTSKTKSYKYAVAIGGSSGTWSVYRWSESYAAAAKFARAEQGRWPCKAEILEVSA